MNEPLSLYLTLFLVSLVPGLLSLLLSLLLPRKRFARFHGGKRYSFLSDFPFELYEGEQKDVVLPKVFLFGFAGFFLLLSAFPLFLQATPDFHFLLPLGILSTLLSASTLFLFCFLCLVPAYEGKRHLTLVPFYGAASLISMVVDALMALNLGKTFPEFKMTGFLFMLALLVLALLSALLLMNPKMGDWARLTSTMNEDGSTVTSRPKVFVLAATEWGIFFLNLLASILVASMLLVYCFLLLS
ncbi:MAG: hypothetical protein ACI4UT_00730 [Candidatus Enteromonas sp.]